MTGDVPAAVTESVAELPAMMVVDCGCVVTEGDVHAASVMVIVAPATVSVPVRAAPVFAATVKPTVPFPLPLAPEVIVIHDVVLEVDQAQLALLVTVIDPLPPGVSNVNELGVAL